MLKLLMVGGSLWVLACGGERAELAYEGGENVAVSQQAILNGDEIAAGSNPGAVAVYVPGRIAPCSGTVIRPHWVLTARHCMTDTGQATGTPLPATSFWVDTGVNPGPSRPATAVRASRLIAHPDHVDIALLGFGAPIPGPFLGLWDGDYERLAPDILDGTASVRLYGYGHNTLSGAGGGRLRWARLKVLDVYDDTIWFQATNGRLTMRGDSGGPGLMKSLIGQLLRPDGVASVHSWSADPATPPLEYCGDVFVPDHRSWIKRSLLVPGDTSGDRRADIVLTGPANWSTIPVANFKSDGTIAVTNRTVESFPELASAPGARKVSGDFNGDGWTDVAVLGGSGWTRIFTARSGGNGNYAFGSFHVGDFGAWATSANVKAVPGDFNGDGFDDIALTGPSGWTTLPIALSNGTGFTVVNKPFAVFPGLAAAAGAKPISGDFNGDTRHDIAIVGVRGWTTVPVAFGQPDGTFTATNKLAGEIPNMGATAGAKAVSGDFNGDGRDDIAFAGAPGWFGVRVAYSLGDGTFNLEIEPVPADWSVWASSAGAQIVAGDFNGDRRDDLAITGPSGWSTIPVAYSGPDGSFSAVNHPVANVPGWAATAGAVALSGYKPQ